jgi:hypothetical protein
LIVEALGIDDVLEALTGTSGSDLTSTLARLADEVGVSAGLMPAEGWAADGNTIKPELQELWDDGERRRDELLGRTREAVAS